ncbi:hypothetical protein V2J09_007077 [Rumex salicifolius]
MFVRAPVQLSCLKGAAHFSNSPLLHPIASQSRLFQCSRPCSTRNRIVPPPLFLSIHRFRYVSTMQSNCFGSLISSEYETASNLASVVDQTLLMVSIFLTYVAGVIPTTGDTYKDLPRKVLDDAPSSTNSDQITPVWESVKEKIQDSLNAIEQGDSIENDLLVAPLKQPLSLCAIVDGSRFRLLWCSVEQLENEVNELPDLLDIVDRDGMLVKFSTTLQKACQKACLSWIEGEFLRESCKPDRALVSSLSEKLKADDIILKSIMKSGKMDLYADLLYFLRYKSCREGCLYDHNLYSLHGASILEDLVITISDGISSIYLELISVDGEISNKVNNLGLNLCALTTRALQKTRNKVTMHQWFYQNFEAVASMYEDCFDLCTLQIGLFPQSTQENSEKSSWWNQLFQKKSKAVLSSYAVISPSSISVKRTKELRALTGWKYYFSLVLELSDIMEPMAKTAITQVSRAISFFLVTLIGRSLGLIYTGIRQSLRLNSV